MEGRCERHLFDQAVDVCGMCGGEYCNDCIVYSFGPKKPPFCLPCAVARAGIRSSAAAYKPLPARQQRKLRKQRLADEAKRTPPAAPDDAPAATPDATAEGTYEWFAASGPG